MNPKNPKFKGNLLKYKHFTDILNPRSKPIGFERNFLLVISPLFLKTDHRLGEGLGTLRTPLVLG